MTSSSGAVGALARWTWLPLLLSLLPRSAAADCFANVPAGTVTCPRQDYDDLVDEAVEARADADSCALVLHDTQIDLHNTQTALSACTGSNAACSVEIAKLKQPNWRPFIGYVVGLAGGVMVALAPKDNVALMATGGVALAAGLVLTIPF